jgi:hypothetical protein
MDTAASPDTPIDDPPVGWSVQRVLALVVVAALVAFWVWAFSPWAPNEKADAIHHQPFLDQAEQACATMQYALDTLPVAPLSATAVDRANTVAASAPVFEQLIIDLRAASSGLVGREAQLVAQWIADWQTYAADRQAYAQALRTDERAVFIVTARGGGQITRTMDGFTRVNDLASCLVPQDV